MGKKSLGAEGALWPGPRRPMPAGLVMQDSSRMVNGGAARELGQRVLTAGISGTIARAENRRSSIQNAKKGSTRTARHRRFINTLPA